MGTLFNHIRVRNFRCLRDVALPLGPITTLIGSNGSGKTTLLDSIWFVRDCAARDADLATSQRHHGVGILHDAAPPGEGLSVELTTNTASYFVTARIASGRIDPYLGETLKVGGHTLIERLPGTDRARFWNQGAKDTFDAPLRKPESLSLSRYLDFENRVAEAFEFDRYLRGVRLFTSRSFTLWKLRSYGSEDMGGAYLDYRAETLWSLLRNLDGKRRLHSGYETILRFMEEAFPGLFDGIAFEAQADTVIASFLEKGRRNPVRASGVSDGVLQMLILLTALFANKPDWPELVMFDEPETSLHPWALAVFARAVRHATSKWHRQVILATHSPALMSQFEPGEVVVAEQDGGNRVLRPLSTIEEVRDLLDEYSIGSIYMANALARQASEADPQPQGREA
jgi:ABC-type branched-subunit amino acid transport system ATPase component